ncbi:MAG: hypothetical protein AVDCRST_MAG59-4648, partial [uncultured Thermomicrobiales bacterium]
AGTTGPEGPRPAGGAGRDPWAGGGTAGGDSDGGRPIRGSRVRRSRRGDPVATDSGPAHPDPGRLLGRDAGCHPGPSPAADAGPPGGFGGRAGSGGRGVGGLPHRRRGGGGRCAGDRPLPRAALRRRRAAACRCLPGGCTGAGRGAGQDRLLPGCPPLQRGGGGGGRLGRRQPAPARAVAVRPGAAFGARPRPDRLAGRRRGAAGGGTAARGDPAGGHPPGVRHRHRARGLWHGRGAARGEPRRRRPRDAGAALRRRADDRRPAAGDRTGPAGGDRLRRPGDGAGRRRGRAGPDRPGAGDVHRRLPAADRSGRSPSGAGDGGFVRGGV